MTQANGSKVTDIKINSDKLYKEEVFTDLMYASIRRFTPINIDGSIDESREVAFAGMTQLMSPDGPVPVQCRIEGAKDLSDAVAKLPGAIEKAVREMIAESEEIERKEKSRIVVPGR